jgi:methionyl-tRNA formyltransferase
MEKLKEAYVAVNPDVQIVVAFRMLPESVWSLPPKGTYNLHASLLPKFRGAAPINHAIIAGESETGVTAFRLKHEIDTGDVAIRRTVPISENDNAGTLHDKLKELAAEIAVELVDKINSGTITFTKQDDSVATKAPKIYHETCRIDFSKPVQQVHNFIRGLSPYPGAWCLIGTKEFKILISRPELHDDPNPSGHLLTDNKKMLKVKCADGYIWFTHIKAEGKKAMPIADLLNGLKIAESQAS